MWGRRSQFNAFPPHDTPEKVLQLDQVCRSRWRLQSAFINQSQFWAYICPFVIKMDPAPMEGLAQVPTELRFKPFIYSKQGRIKGGATGAIAPGPSLQGSTPWWHLFVSNEIFVEKIVIQKRYKNTNPIFRWCVEYHQWFLCKFDFLPVLVITTEKIFSVLFNANIIEFCL